jgi:tRNA (uracil-5-)-methyltransferase
LPYDAQLERKKRRLSALLESFYDGEISVYPSADAHYRMRAEFRIWHEDGGACYAMGNAQKNGVVTITECPKVSEAIDTRMWRLLEAINASPDTLKRKLFGVEFLSTLTGECLITMLYHRKLDEGWRQEAEAHAGA